ncbi:hypothetical protein FOA52_012535 [Chlamydomonas sp. UWO 241]|nr:hypothetical protein FOA52_012535 [Chlamydomonas sp. UWO 241]
MQLSARSPSTSCSFVTPARSTRAAVRSRVAPGRAPTVRTAAASQNHEATTGLTAVGAPSRPLSAGHAQLVLHQRNRRATVVAASSPGESGAPAGQVTVPLMDSMRANITEALGATRGLGRTRERTHTRMLCIDVVSEAFEGKQAMDRQRMLYKAIWLELQEAVHAVDSMVTQTPAEAGL